VIEHYCVSIDTSEKRLRMHGCQTFSLETKNAILQWHSQFLNSWVAIIPGECEDKDVAAMLDNISKEANE
jgi:hypothetical protein